MSSAATTGRTPGCCPLQRGVRRRVTVREEWALLREGSFEACAKPLRSNKAPTEFEEARELAAIDLWESKQDRGIAAIVVGDVKDSWIGLQEKVAIVHGDLDRYCLTILLETEQESAFDAKRGSAVARSLLDARQGCCELAHVGEGETDPAVARAACRDGAFLRRSCGWQDRYPPTPNLTFDDSVTDPPKSATPC